MLKILSYKRYKKLLKEYEYQKFLAKNLEEQKTEVVMENLELRTKIENLEHEISHLEGLKKELEAQKQKLSKKRENENKRNRQKELQKKKKWLQAYPDEDYE